MSPNGILNIYSRYRVLKNIQRHQLAVAGVAAVICDHFNQSVNYGDVIAACLLHDMGNIMKIPLENTLFPGDLEPEGREYWSRVKAEVGRDYGPDDHSATMAMVREIMPSRRVVELVDSIGFLQATANAKSLQFDQKICAYADMRVGPWGVVSLSERFADLRRRYHGERALVPPPQVIEFEAALVQIEKQIFERASITPDDITDDKVSARAAILRSFDLRTNIV